MNTLYHYCSTSTFHAIVQNASVWLCSLSMSNDSLEGKLVSRTLGRLGAHDQLSADQVERIQREVGQIEELFDGLALCLSEEGDLLSQWRGYGADGSGVSIGFNRTYIEQAVQDASGPEFKHLGLSKVVYEPREQDELLRDFYAHVRERYGEDSKSTAYYRSVNQGKKEPGLGDFGWVDQVMDANYWKLWQLVPRLYLLKPPAFREENEWRLHTIQTRGLAGASKYRATSNRLIPYLKFDIRPEQKPICKVILGPKHASDTSTARAFLQSCGFGRVEVAVSDASYQ